MSATLCAQGTTAGVYAVDESPIVVPKPAARNVAGGTLINVNYVGSGINDTFKGAFERACKIWEENIPTTLPIKLKCDNWTDCRPLVQRPKLSCLCEHDGQ